MVPIFFCVIVSSASSTCLRLHRSLSAQSVCISVRQSGVSFGRSISLSILVSFVIIFHFIQNTCILCSSQVSPNVLYFLMPLAVRLQCKYTKHTVYSLHHIRTPTQCTYRFEKKRRKPNTPSTRARAEGKLLFIVIITEIFTMFFLRNAPLCVPRQI